MIGRRDTSLVAAKVHSTWSMQKQEYEILKGGSRADLTEPGVARDSQDHSDAAIVLLREQVPPLVVVGRLPMHTVGSA